jgi:hypothetical protein
VPCCPCPLCIATLPLDPAYAARPELSPVVRGRNSTQSPGALGCAPHRPRVASPIKCERPSPHVPAAPPPPKRSNPRPPLRCKSSPASPSLAPPYLSRSAASSTHRPYSAAATCLSSGRPGFPIPLPLVTPSTHAPSCSRGTGSAAAPRPPAANCPCACPCSRALLHASLAQHR